MRRLVFHLPLCILSACGAQTRSVPDDVLPTASRETASLVLGDGGASASVARRVTASSPSRKMDSTACAIETAPNEFTIQWPTRDMLLTQIGGGYYTPIMDAQGGMRGYQIAQDSACLSDLGLIAGDLITGVNGIDIRNNNEAMKRIYESISTTLNVEVHVERGGAGIDLHYHLAGAPTHGRRK